MDLDKIYRAFKRNRFACTIFETAEEAAAYLSQEIHGKTVGMGDSMTLESMKMYERLSENNEVYDVQHIENKDYTSKERMEQFLSMARKCLMTDVFLTSANAAAETGELVNIDGTGNRISGSLFGHRKVYFIIGVNKICPTLDDAIFRARNVDAQKHVARPHFFFDRSFYKIGCSFFNYEKCCDCSAPDRICNALVIYYKKMRNMDMEVVIINEELGL